MSNTSIRKVAHNLACRERIDKEKMSAIPSQAQKKEAAGWLLKPLQLEAKLGCQNAAVAGGLEKWLARVSEKLVLQAGLTPAEAEHLLAPLSGYAGAGPGERERKIAEVNARLAALGAAADTESGGVARPEPASLPTRTQRPARTPARKPNLSKPKPSPKAMTRTEGGETTATGPVDLDTPVQYLRGVGPQRGRLLHKLGVDTAADLLRYFPRDWQDRRRLARIGDLKPGETATVSGVVKLRTTLYLRRGLKLTKVVIDDGTGLLTGTWFNQPFMKDRFQDGQRVIFYGTAEKIRGFQISNPDYELLESGEDDLIHTGRIVPVYPSTERLSQRVLRTIQFGLLARVPDALPEILPPAVMETHRFPAPAQALRCIHFPENYDVLQAARARLIFEELFLQQIAMLRLKRRYREENGTACNISGPLLQRFSSALPFPLTGAQLRTRDEILQDLAQTRPMHRLLQGDVGSGKTIVAVLAMLAAVDSGLQAALMAPTEILAIQHFLTLKRLLQPCGVVVELFTSAASARERKILHRRLAAGEIQIAVGTHALTQEQVEFRALGLAVVDEQHRFGVEQRSLLRAKGERPHVLVMTATPIPRTLALTAFGDLDVSTLDELPPGRKPVATHWLHHSAARQAYQHALSEIQAGRQVYVIFPLVEESEKVDLKAVTTEYQRLAQDVFSKNRVGLMHGQLPTEEKEQVMAAFKAGELEVLVATSVVEVGVDVPNAALMIIENAERFGLAQLHQLRGRIGRGADASTCYLIGDPHTEDGKIRLSIMIQIADGFKVAEEDLKMRGPGEFFGLRQHGLPDLKLADLIRDAPVIEDARQAAGRLLQEDPDLTQPAVHELKRLHQRIYGEREQRLLAG
jgi:ATP-dependent DNA helicase RecG